MTATPPSGPGGLPIPVPDEPDEPMAADKRTILVAVVVMFALVLVGVVSAAVFTTSACDAIDPDPTEHRVAGTDVEEVLTSAFGDSTDLVEVEELAAAIDELTDDLGPVTGLADVSGAEALTLGATGPMASGNVTTALGPDGDNVVATVEFGDATIVGSGDALYSLAIGNELTGQVDALLPVDGQLEAGTCVDTATIGTPLAFALDADGGELLLLRVEEDGDDPELELRDPVAGSRWTAPLELSVAQPGVLGQRLTGQVGPEHAVVGFRTTPDGDVPVLTAVDRVDGTVGWELDRRDLEGPLEEEAPELIDVLAVDQELALVAVTVDRDEDEEAGDAADVGTTLLALSLEDGTTVWETPLSPGQQVVDAELSGQRAILAVSGSDGVAIVEAGPDGATPVVTIDEASHGRVGQRDDGSTVAVIGATVVVARDGGVSQRGAASEAVDVVVAGPAVTVLFGSSADDAAAVAVTFGG